MLANWIKESTATTGTGTISLGGAVAGHVPFSAQFASGDRVLYSITDGNNREIGLGTLSSGSPWTLARTTVLETLAAGTFDDSAPAPITLSGSATVAVDMARQAILPDMRGAPIYSGGVHLPPNISTYNYGGKAGGEFSSQAGRIVLLPVTLPQPTRISEVGAHITTASAGGNFRIGMYAAKRDGSPGALLFDSGNISTAATGLILASLASPVVLPAGHYYAADCVDNTTAIAHGPRGATGATFDSRYGTDTAQYPCNKRPYYDQTYGALPASWPTPSGHINSATFGIVWR